MTGRAPGDPAVRLERVLDAPVAEVYAAWADPASLAQWLSPSGSAEVQADVRVGGALHVVMVGAGMRIEHHGEFRTVQPPTLLSFTWRSTYTGDAPTLVTVTLEDAGSGQTRLRLVHEHLPPGAAASHGGGWGVILDNLAAVLRGGSGTARS